MPQIDRARALALHEAAHALLMRYMGIEVAGVTIRAGRDFVGRAWSPAASPDGSASSTMRECSEDCYAVQALAPGPGESRLKARFGNWLCDVITNLVILLAGQEAERLAGVTLSELSTHDDHRALEYARTIVFTSNAVGPLINYARAEAANLLQGHWETLNAIADALDEHGTIDGERLDTIILQSLAQARLRSARLHREGWSQTIKNAAGEADRFVGSRAGPDEPIGRGSVRVL